MEPEILRPANTCQQLIALRSVSGVARAATTIGFLVGDLDGSLGLGKMAFADAEAVERVDFMAAFITRRFWPEVVFDILPGVASLIITRAERAARVVAAMDHAVFAARIARFAVHNAVFVPLHFLQHLLVTGVMAVGHEVTRRFPAADVVG